MCQSQCPLMHNVLPTEYPDDLLQAALASFSAGNEGPGSEQLARVEQARHSSSLGVDDDDIDEDEVGDAHRGCINHHLVIFIDQYNP